LNLLDRHLLREWLKIFGLVLVATLGLLLLQAMYDEFADLLEQQAKILDVLVYFAVTLPGFLAFVLPLALLLSLLYTLGQLHRNNEITAQRAAGLGLLRITRPLWVVGVLLGLLVGWLNASVVPWSVEESRSILQDLKFRHAARVEGAGSAGVRADVAFDNPRQGRMWFFNRYSELTNRGYGVTVSELDNHRHETTRLLAREAHRGPGGHGWVFFDGREIWLDPATGGVTRTLPFTEKDEPRFSEDPSLMFIFDLKPADLSFFELERIMTYFEVEANPKLTIYAVRYYGLLADTMVPLIVILLAVPFAVTGVRVNPAVGASKSLGLFALYFLLVKTSYTCGGLGLVDPLWAALLPNLVMLALGGIVFARAR
jgi:lipopolysaccharide export system permease protein